MKGILVSANRTTKQFIVAFTDFLLILFSISFSVLLFSENTLINSLAWVLHVSIIPLISVVIFFILGVYRSVLRFINFSSIYLLLKSIFIVLIFILCLNLTLSWLNYSFLIFPFKDNLSSFTPLASIFSILLNILFLVGIRLFANYFLSEISSTTRVAIYGAGSAGIQLAGALRLSTEMQPVAFIDSNKSLHNTFIGDMKVLEPEKLKKLVSRKKIDEVLIAIPSAPKSTLRSLLKQIEGYSIKVRILPGLAELASGKITVSELKDIEVTDLLGRLEVEANTPLLEKNIKDKVVLVTGAGGSIGSEISRQIVSIGSRKLVLLDSSEFALYRIKSELEKRHSGQEIITVIANVTDKGRMANILNSLSIDTIFHAAAYKHVPLVEENPFEGFYNNVIGTKTCLEEAINNSVETFVLISTDKAVRPTNIMGATKRLAEMILQSYSMQPDVDIKMTMVRFGNVLGSSGSAVPLFQQQIKEGGPVTVTHPKVIRYFMSIPEAAELVIQASALGKGGDVFVLDMGEPVNIYELAKRLINISGLRVKDEDNAEGDIEIVFTGLRPGEKLYEELLIGDNVSTTSHKQIFRAEEECIEKDEVEGYIKLIIEASETNNVKKYKELLEEVIHGYVNKDEIVDVLSMSKKG